jgi:hypothetical protein
VAVDDETVRINDRSAPVSGMGGPVSYAAHADGRVPGCWMAQVALGGHRHPPLRCLVPELVGAGGRIGQRRSGRMGMGWVALQPEVLEDGSDHSWGSDGGDQLHTATAAWTIEHVEAEGSGHQVSPLAPVPRRWGHGQGGRAPLGIGGQHAVVDEEVGSRAGDEGSETGEELERLEQQIGRAVVPGARQLDEERYLETFTQSPRRRLQERGGPWRPSNNSREAPSVCAVMLTGGTTPPPGAEPNDDSGSGCRVPAGGRPSPWGVIGSVGLGLIWFRRRTAGRRRGA